MTTLLAMVQSPYADVCASACTAIARLNGRPVSDAIAGALADVVWPDAEHPTRGLFVRACAAVALCTTLDTMAADGVACDLPAAWTRPPAAEPVACGIAFPDGGSPGGIFVAQAQHTALGRVVQDAVARVQRRLRTWKNPSLDSVNTP